MYQSAIPRWDISVGFTLIHNCTSEYPVGNLGARFGRGPRGWYKKLTFLNQINGSVSFWSWGFSGWYIIWPRDSFWRKPAGPRWSANQVRKNIWNLKVTYFNITRVIKQTDRHCQNQLILVFVLHAQLVHSNRHKHETVNCCWTQVQMLRIVSTPQINLQLVTRWCSLPNQSLSSNQKSGSKFKNSPHQCKAVLSRQLCYLDLINRKIWDLDLIHLHLFPLNSISLVNYHGELDFAHWLRALSTTTDMQYRMSHTVSSPIRYWFNPQVPLWIRNHVMDTFGDFSVQ